MHMGIPDKEGVHEAERIVVNLCAEVYMHVEFYMYK
jgi:hypothetical protein